MIRANSPTSADFTNDLVTSFDNNGNTSSRIRRNKQIQLPDDFEPSAYDVLCGRDKKSFNHIGNRRFRVTIAMNLKHYTDAKTKIQKTLVVVSLVDMIRSLSPNGGFVKQDANGKWYEIGDKLARAKVGHALRDLIVSIKKSEERKATKENQLSQSRQAILQHKQAQAQDLEIPTLVSSNALNDVQWRTLSNNEVNTFDGMRQPLKVLDDEMEPFPIRSGSINGISEQDMTLLANLFPRASFNDRASFNNVLSELPMEKLLEGVAEPDTVGSAPVPPASKRVSDLFLTMAGLAQRRRISANSE